MTDVQTDTTLCDPQDMAGRLHTALSDLVRDCKARMLRPRPGHQPTADLSGFRLGITWLAQQRQMDSMLDLAEQLVREAPALVGGHGRKPETLDQLRACMVPVLRALPEVNRPPAQRLEWLFGTLLVDELQCLPHAEVMAVLERNAFQPRHWQYIVPYLEQNLPKVKGTGLSWQGQERRRRLLGYAWQACQKAGWADRAEALFRRELSVCACYGELAELLVHRGDVEEAQTVLLKGIAKYNASRPELTMGWLDRLESLNGVG
ncbi:hypothetical protein [Saccharospirillum salsuginis]|uniref:Uncharacterized protein n=1 Tax=Saccharospirillum salsuginis TaxID=418750 RepID=A0A918KDK2_9GAMM|nr:hypothetical protein [Saccharospirillum salsuginis]GGX59550.1 hypothetical protein GCM10007392_29370 [Saccharospirillum salsuginis]